MRVAPVTQQLQRNPQALEKALGQPGGFDFESWQPSLAKIAPGDQERETMIDAGGDVGAFETVASFAGVALW